MAKLAHGCLAFHEPLPDRTLRVFCFYGSGQSAVNLRHLAFPAGVERCLVELPGRGLRSSDGSALCDDLVAVAAEAADALAPLCAEGPWAVWAYSLGCAIGFEFLRALQQRRRRWQQQQQQLQQQQQQQQLQQQQQQQQAALEAQQKAQQQAALQAQQQQQQRAQQQAAVRAQQAQMQQQAAALNAQRQQQAMLAQQQAQAQAQARAQSQAAQMIQRAVRLAPTPVPSPSHHRVAEAHLLRPR